MVEKLLSNPREYFVDQAPCLVHAHLGNGKCPVFGMRPAMEASIHVLIMHAVFQQCLVSGLHLDCDLYVVPCHPTWGLDVGLEAHRVKPTHRNTFNHSHTL